MHPTRPRLDVRPLSGKGSIHKKTMCCPITGELMWDPVTTCDGHTYERSAIGDWLTRSNTSPKTGAVLPVTMVFPNLNMRISIAR